MSEALVERGHEVHVVTYPLGHAGTPTPYYVHRVGSPDSQVAPEPGPSFKKLFVLDPLLVRKVRHLLDETAFDVIHAHHYEGLIAALLARRSGDHLPIAFDSHTLLGSELHHYRSLLPASALSWIGRRFDKNLPRRADHVIAVTERMRDWLTSDGAVPAARTSLIPNGVEHEHFAMQDTTVTRAQGNERANSAMRIVFSGNLAEYQGIDMLLRAFQRVHADRPDSHLVFITDSGLEPIAGKLEALGIDAYVSSIDADYASLPARLAEADVLVNPRTDCDGIPQKLLNYMAAGRPIVSFAGSAALLENGSTALIVDDEDTDAFASAIIRVVEEPGVGERLGRAAQAEAIKRHGWQNVAQKVEAVYSSLTGNANQTTWMSQADRTDTVHVAVASDANYVMALAAMLASLEARLDPHCELVVHVIGTDLPKDDWRRLRASAPAERVRWNCIELSSSLLTDLDFKPRAYEHITSVCFFRLLLPELLPADLPKVLYLDSDLIAGADISQLWRIEIHDVPLAAVPEWDRNASRASSPRGIRRYRDLGLSPEQPLFNSGVMLLDLEHWRRKHLAHRAFQYIREAGPDVRWYEQEALNVVCNGQFLELDSRWNVPAGEVAALARDDVSIVHYLTADKPWHWHYDSVSAAPFFDALDRTAWAGWRPTRPHLGDVGKLAGRVVKAVKKRQFDVYRLRSDLDARRRYRRARPKYIPLGGIGLPPDGTGPEIRLFVTAPTIDADLLQELAAWFADGVDRAVLLLEGDGNAGTLIPDSHAQRVHAFVCDGHDTDFARRNLLHHHGQSHWCVLGRPGEHIVTKTETSLDLRRLCAELDADGLEACAGSCVDIEKTAEVELVARDALSNRLFRGDAAIAPAESAYDVPAFLSRIVLLKYGDDVLLDAGANLCGSMRKSQILLRLRPRCPQSGP
jgi:lipopolysaccharide biosynthesis glycosyltransferase/glycosyltransferase involved in cell wall biosynthesis